MAHGGMEETRKLSQEEARKLSQEEARKLSQEESRKLSQEEQKRAAAEKAVDLYVRSGMAVGLGTGSTAVFAVRRIGALLTAGELEGVVAVPTSDRTQEEARKLGIPLTSLDVHPVLDLTIDGADSVDRNLDLVKGGGGAQLREKVVAMASKVLVIAVDESKLCDRVGLHFPVPVEVVPFCHGPTARAIEELASLRGCRAVLRLDRPRLPTATAERLPAGAAERLPAVTQPVSEAKGGDCPCPAVTDNGNYILDLHCPAVTDNGNYILDLHCPKPIEDPRLSAQELKATVGVVEHGLFVGMASAVVVAGPDGVSVRTPT